MICRAVTIPTLHSTTSFRFASVDRMTIPTFGLNLAALWNQHGMLKPRIDWKCSCAAPSATVKSTWRRPKKLSPRIGLTLKLREQGRNKMKPKSMLAALALLMSGTAYAFDGLAMPQHDGASFCYLLISTVTTAESDKNVLLYLVGMGILGVVVVIYAYIQYRVTTMSDHDNIVRLGPHPSGFGREQALKLIAENPRFTLIDQESGQGVEIIGARGIPPMKCKQCGNPISPKAFECSWCG
jgi:hypothetical protein